MTTIGHKKILYFFELFMLSEFYFKLYFVSVCINYLLVDIIDLSKCLNVAVMSDLQIMLHETSFEMTIQTSRAIQILLNILKSSKHNWPCASDTSLFCVDIACSFFGPKLILHFHSQSEPRIWVEKVKMAVVIIEWIHYSLSIFIFETFVWIDALILFNKVSTLCVYMYIHIVYTHLYLLIYQVIIKYNLLSTNICTCKGFAH